MDDKTTISDRAPYDIIASILLLALFIVMTSDAFTAYEVWTTHVDGALSILVS